MFSDQQLVTGIAMLGAGFSQLSYSLPVYYWRIILQLTWFSSVTHLATMSLLQQYFQKYSAARWWRISLMIALAAMQMVALVPSGFIDWNGANVDEIYKATFSIPVACYFSQNAYAPGGVIFKDTMNLYASDGLGVAIHYGGFTMTMAYLTISYATRLVKLSESKTLFFRSWFRTKPGRLCKKLMVRLHHRATGANSIQAKMAWIFVHKSVLVVFTLLRATLDLTGSILWEYADILFNPQFFAFGPMVMGQLLTHFGFL